VLLGNADLKDFQFAVVQSDAVIKSARSGCFRFSIWQQNLRWAVLQHHVSDVGICDIADLLRGHDNDGILMAHRLKPITQSAAEGGMLEI